MNVRERERQRETERQRDRETERETETERQRDRDRERETEREAIVFTYFLQNELPFAVVGSRDEIEIAGKKVRARKYPWGTVEGNEYLIYYIF